MTLLKWNGAPYTLKDATNDNTYFDLLVKGLVGIGVPSEEAEQKAIEITHNENYKGEGRIWVDGMGNDGNCDGRNYGYIITHNGENFFVEFTYSSWDNSDFNQVYKCITEEKTVSIIKKITIQ